jgi:hypothetical protein
VALAVSALVHGSLAALVYLMSLWGYGGFDLPRREYAVDVVGVSPEQKPAAAPAEEPKKPEPETKAEPEKPKPKGDTAKKASPAKQKAKPEAAPVKAPPAPDDAPVVATKDTPKPEEPAAGTPQGEDKPAIPWPLDEPEAAAATSVDLPGAAPGDAALLVAFRLDRLRSGPWAQAVERILEPMPDYETIIAGSGSSMAELFDLLFIATPDVTDVTATFLAAHHHRDEEELKSTLVGGAKARVAWAPASGGTVGKRAPGAGVLAEDPRVFLIPEAGWILLARPEQLPGMLDAEASADAGAVAKPKRPKWMERMVALVGDPKEAGKPGPVAIFAVANLKRRLVVPGVGAMPAPAATIVSVFAEPDGFRAVGLLEFPSDAAATEFVAAAEKTRDAALGSLITRHFIAKVSAEKAVGALKFVARGKQVAVTTRVSAEDARAMLAAAAKWSADWFSRHRGDLE